MASRHADASVASVEQRGGGGGDVDVVHAAPQPVPTWPVMHSLGPPSESAAGRGELLASSANMLRAHLGTSLPGASATAGAFGDVERASYDTAAFRPPTGSAPSGLGDQDNDFPLDSTVVATSAAMTDIAQPAAWSSLPRPIPPCAFDAAPGPDVAAVPRAQGRTPAREALHGAAPEHENFASAASLVEDGVWSARQVDSGMSSRCSSLGAHHRMAPATAAAHNSIHHHYVESSEAGQRREGGEPHRGDDPQPTRSASEVSSLYCSRPPTASGSVNHGMGIQDELDVFDERAALQAAVDAAVRFDDLSNEDDVVEGEPRRDALTMDPNVLAQLLNVAAAEEAAVLRVASPKKASSGGLLSPFAVPAPSPQRLEPHAAPAGRGGPLSDRLSGAGSLTGCASSLLLSPDGHELGRGHHTQHQAQPHHHSHRSRSSSTGGGGGSYLYRGTTSAATSLSGAGGAGPQSRLSQTAFADVFSDAHSPFTSTASQYLRRGDSEVMGLVTSPPPPLSQTASIGYAGLAGLTPPPAAGATTTTAVPTSATADDAAAAPLTHQQPLYAFLLSSTAPGTSGITNTASVPPSGLTSPAQSSVSGFVPVSGAPYAQLHHHVARHPSRSASSQHVSATTAGAAAGAASASGAPPHGRGTPPSGFTQVPIMDGGAGLLPAVSAAAGIALPNPGAFRYVSPPQFPIAVLQEQQLLPSQALQSSFMGGSSAPETSTMGVSVAVNSTSTAGGGGGGGGAASRGTTCAVSTVMHTAVGAGQTPINSLLSSPNSQAFYLHQVPSVTSTATLTGDAQPPPPQSGSFMLYSPPQVCVSVGGGGAGQSITTTHATSAVSATTNSTSPAAAVVTGAGESHRTRSVSPSGTLYQLPAATQQQQQQQLPPQQQALGGYSITSAPGAAAAAATALALAAPRVSDDSSRVTRNIYFRNLPTSWNTSLLRELCTRYGTVMSAKVAHHATTNESLGYGFVLFEHRRCAATCVAMLNQAVVRRDGEEPRTLLVRMAHATAVPVFQEEGSMGASGADAAAAAVAAATSGLQSPSESTPPSSSVSRTQGTAAAAAADVMAWQQQYPPHHVTSGLTSPRSPAGGWTTQTLPVFVGPNAMTAGAVLQPPPPPPPPLPQYLREPSNLAASDTFGPPMYYLALADSCRTNMNTSLTCSGLGASTGAGDSAYCTSPSHPTAAAAASGGLAEAAIGGGGMQAATSHSRSASAAASRSYLAEALNASVGASRNLGGGGGGGAATPSSSAAVPPLRGLYRPPSAATTTPALFCSDQMPHPQEHQLGSFLSYSASASGNVSMTCGASAAAAAMAANRSSTGNAHSFTSPLSLSPSHEYGSAVESVRPTPSTQPSQSLPTAALASTSAAAPTSSSAVSTRNVYITNLPLTWNTTKLRELCGRFGEIVSASVAHHQKTNESRGYGFVLFSDERDAASCVRTLHQYHVPNSPHVLNCRFAKDKATPSIAHTLLQESALGASRVEAGKAPGGVAVVPTSPVVVTGSPGGSANGSAGGCGSLLLAAVVGVPMAATTAHTMVPMIAMRGNGIAHRGTDGGSGRGGDTGDVMDPAELFESGLTYKGGRGAVGSSEAACGRTQPSMTPVQLGGDAVSVVDAVCMPINVFCTLQQRVRTQGAHYVAHQQRQCRGGGDGAADHKSTENAVVDSAAAAEALEAMMRSCVVYGANVPAQGYGGVRPTDCPRVPQRRHHGETVAAAAAEELAPAPASTTATTATALPTAASSPDLLSFVSGLFAETLNGVAEGGAAASPHSSSIVCTHAIPAGRSLVFPVACSATGSAAASATEASAWGSAAASAAEAPEAASRRRNSHSDNGGGCGDGGSTTPSKSRTSPATPVELWYTCTLFTSPAAAEDFVREAAAAGAAAGTPRHLLPSGGGSSGGGTLSPAAQTTSRDSLPASVRTSPAPPAAADAAVPGMRFGLRDEVVVLNSAPLAVAAGACATATAASPLSHGGTVAGGARRQLSTPVPSDPSANAPAAAVLSSSTRTPPSIRPAQASQPITAYQPPTATGNAVMDETAAAHQHQPAPPPPIPVFRPMVFGAPAQQPPHHLQSRFVEASQGPLPSPLSMKSSGHGPQPLQQVVFAAAAAATLPEQQMQALAYHQAHTPSALSPQPAYASYAHPALYLTSPTGAVTFGSSGTTVQGPLTSPLPMMLLPDSSNNCNHGGGGGVLHDLQRAPSAAASAMTSPHATGSGWYPAVSLGDCTYLISSPLSSSVNGNAVTNLTSNPATPPLGMQPGGPALTSPYFAAFGRAAASAMHNGAMPSRAMPLTSAPHGTAPGGSNNSTSLAAAAAALRSPPPPQSMGTHAAGGVGGFGFGHALFTTPEGATVMLPSMSAVDAVGMRGAFATAAQQHQRR